MGISMKTSMETNDVNHKDLALLQKAKDVCMTIYDGLNTLERLKRSNNKIMFTLQIQESFISQILNASTRITTCIAGMSSKDTKQMSGELNEDYGNTTGQDHSKSISHQATL